MTVSHKKQQSCCDTCSNFVFDDDCQCYTCMIKLDEDEMYHFLNESNYSCPYYKVDDEYAVVRKQN